jgi:hypothetical protein
MDFDVDMFRVARMGDDRYEADLHSILAHYQETYFSDVGVKVQSIEFATALESPGVVETGGSSPLIKVDESLRYFPKLCCFIVLHELIDNCLFWKCGSVQPYEGDEFQEKVKRLWQLDAYYGLL